MINLVGGRNICEQLNAPPPSGDPLHALRTGEVNHDEIEKLINDLAIEEIRQRVNSVNRRKSMDAMDAIADVITDEEANHASSIIVEYGATRGNALLWFGDGEDNIPFYLDWSDYGDGKRYQYSQNQWVDQGIMPPTQRIAAPTFMLARAMVGSIAAAIQQVLTTDDCRAAQRAFDATSRLIDQLPFTLARPENAAFWMWKEYDPITQGPRFHIAFLYQNMEAKADTDVFGYIMMACHPYEGKWLATKRSEALLPTITLTIPQAEILVKDLTAQFGALDPGMLDFEKKPLVVFGTDAAPMPITPVIRANPDISPLVDQIADAVVRKLAERLLGR